VLFASSSVGDDGKGVAMDRVFWGIHRTSLCAIKVAKKIAARFGLTPSRFHMLFAIRCERVTWFPQRGLRVLLGVSAQTVSRMIQSLVACGFLLQRVVEGDRRRRELAFTEHGTELMGRAVGEIVLGGLGTHVAGRALTDQGWPCPRAVRATAIEEFDGIVGRLRFGLRDSAFFTYECANQEPRPVYHCFERDYLDDDDSTPDLTSLDEDWGKE
jgi:DNA-binding MarR family transcriptional regulator